MSPTPPKTKLVAYLRTSTVRQVTHGLGLDVQRQAIKAWARDHGHRIVSWHTDAGVSGANGVDSREALYAALEGIRTGRADGLVAYNLDRLARELHVQEGILGQVWAGGGKVFTVEDGEVLEDDPDDPYRTAMRQMRGVFSQLERGVIRARMRAGKRAKIEKGGYAGHGSPPLGQKAEGRELVPEPDEVETVARIHELRADGMSFREICSVLGAEGRRTKRGGQWHPYTVHKILNRGSGN